MVDPRKHTHTHNVYNVIFKSVPARKISESLRHAHMKAHRIVRRIAFGNMFVLTYMRICMYIVYIINKCGYTGADKMEYKTLNRLRLSSSPGILLLWCRLHYNWNYYYYIDIEKHSTSHMTVYPFQLFFNIDGWCGFQKKTYKTHHIPCTQSTWLKINYTNWYECPFFVHIIQLLN